MVYNDPLIAYNDPTYAVIRFIFQLLARVYGLEAQRKDCHPCFDKKFRKGKWRINKYYIRDVSARRSKAWPQQLKQIIQETKQTGAILISYINRLSNPKEQTRFNHH